LPPPPCRRALPGGASRPCPADNEQCSSASRSSACKDVRRRSCRSSRVCSWPYVSLRLVRQLIVTARQMTAGLDCIINGSIVLVLHERKCLLLPDLIS